MSQQEVDTIRRSYSELSCREHYSLHQILHDEELLGPESAALFQLVQDPDKFYQGFNEEQTPLYSDKAKKVI